MRLRSSGRTFRVPRAPATDTDEWLDDRGLGFLADLFAAHEVRDCAGRSCGSFDRD